MMSESQHSVILFGQITGRTRTDRLLMLESLSIDSEKPRIEDTLIIPGAADNPRPVPRRLAEAFFASLTKRQGYRFLDQPIPTEIAERIPVNAYLEKSALLELRALFAILFPTLTARNLKEFRAAFRVSPQFDSHRALGELVRITFRRFANLNRGLQRRLRQLSTHASPPLRAWFESAGARQEAGELNYDDHYNLDLDRRENLTEGELLSCLEMPRILDDVERASNMISGFELRCGQSRYAAAVARALTEGDILLLEGATGTGKSIGYLLPLIARCREENRRAVVATRTKSLQEQLFRSDLDKVRRLIPPGFKISLLKGLANYICLLKYKAHAVQMDALSAEGTFEKLMALAVWEDETKSGDLTETAVFADETADSLRARITLDEISCLGSNCAYYNRCYGFRARKQALKSDLVITNYALLLADLVAGQAIMGRFSYAVLDEAHRLEVEATRAFTSRLPLIYLSRLLSQMSGANLRAYLADLLASSEDTLEQLVELATDAAALSDRLTVLAEAVRVELLNGSRNGADRIGFSVGDPIHALIRDHWQERNEIYDSLVRWLSEVQELLSAAGEAASSPEVAELKRRLSTLADFIRLLGKIAAAEQAEVVLWGEASATSEVAITLAPANVGGLLAAKLFPSYDSVVLTSATLESEDNFDWIARQLGLLPENDIEASRLKISSPFPLNEQLHLSVAGFLPPPSSDRYPPRLAQLIAKLRQSIRMSTLVLCTSYRMIEQLETSLKELGKMPGGLLVQSPDSSPERLLTLFQQSSRGMLIGTESFWEGVDLPGDILRLLILTRLPFAVPDEPLELAKSERATARGENPFVTVSLPAAILKYRQALGRVIRGLSDWGAVIVTDSRIAHKRYGSLFYSASPAEVHVFEQESLLIRDVTRWLYSRQDDAPGNA